MALLTMFDSMVMHVHVLHLGQYGSNACSSSRDTRDIIINVNTSKTKEIRSSSLLIIKLLNSMQT